MATNFEGWNVGRYVAVLAVGLLVAAGVRGEKKANAERDKLQGTWNEVSVQLDGKAMDVHNTVVFSGDKVTIKTKDDTLERSFHLDPTKTPKWVDFLITRGPDKDKKMLGLYQLEGDTLTVCHAMPDGKRPTELASQPGSKVLLVVLKRAKE